jgi:hypothetical protein
MINLNQHDYNQINIRPILTDNVKITILTTYDNCAETIRISGWKFFGKSRWAGNNLYFSKVFFLVDIILPVDFSHNSTDKKINGVLNVEVNRGMAFGLIILPFLHSQNVVLKVVKK